MPDTPVSSGTNPAFLAASNRSVVVYGIQSFATRILDGVTHGQREPYLETMTPG